MSVPETLDKARAIFVERNALYGDSYSYEHFGVILMSLFPEGMALKTPHDFARAANVIMLARKLSRYCWNFKAGGHEDSADDSIVYWAIQKEIDGFNK